MSHDIILTDCYSTIRTPIWAIKESGNKTQLFFGGISYQNINIDFITMNRYIDFCQNEKIIIDFRTQNHDYIKNNFSNPLSVPHRDLHQTNNNLQNPVP